MTWFVSVVYVCLSTSLSITKVYKRLKTNKNYFKRNISIDNVIEDVIYHISTTKSDCKKAKIKGKKKHELEWNWQKGKPIGKLSIKLRVLKNVGIVDEGGHSAQRAPRRVTSAGQAAAAGWLTI